MLIVPTNTPVRHVLGDLVLHDYTLSGNNGDTFQAVAPVAQVIITPTTAISVGATFIGAANNLITFVSSGAWAARVSVLTRIG